MTENTRNTKQVLSMTGFALLAWLLTSTLVRLLSNHLNIPAIDNPWLFLLIHHIPNYVFGLSAFLIVLRFIPEAKDVRPKDDIKLSQILVIFLAAAGLGIIINSAVMDRLLYLLSLLYPFSIANTTSNFNLTGISGAFAGLVLGAGVAGFGEEFIFRKLLYKKMAGSPDILFILVSGISFGIMHTFFTQGIGHIFLGMAFAYIYVRTKSYLLVAILHLIFDAILFFVVPLLKEVINEAVGNIVQFLFIVLCVLSTLFVIFWYRKKIDWNILPATEAGWEFAAGKLPLKAIISSPGMAIYIASCLGMMIYHLF